MDINSLPLEMLIEIFKNTDGPTLGACRRVSKAWKNIIDTTPLLWLEFCERDFKHSSKLAKKKSGDDLTWYHIYKNLFTWINIKKYEKYIKEFYKFSVHDKTHALGVDNGVLPLKDARGVVLYDLITMKYIPLVIQENRCIKMTSTEQVTVLQVKNIIYLQRTVEDPSYEAEGWFRAEDFVLHKDLLFFHYYKDVFKCDLKSPTFNAQGVAHSKTQIRALQYDGSNMYIFTESGNIATATKDGKFIVKPINCPKEWIRQIKHVNAFDDRNYICYSRNLFKIETDYYNHLYLDFPPVTALFFYVDIILLGTRAGEILVYRLDNQQYKSKPIFECIAVLPDGKFPIQLDVCEKRTGPVIVAATFFEIFLVEFFFFPHEVQMNKIVSQDKQNMYNRFMILRDIFEEEGEAPGSGTSTDDGND